MRGSSRRVLVVAATMELLLLVQAVPLAPGGEVAQLAPTEDPSSSSFVPSALWPNVWMRLFDRQTAATTENDDGDGTVAAASLPDHLEAISPQSRPDAVFVLYFVPMPSNHRGQHYVHSEANYAEGLNASCARLKEAGHETIFVGDVDWVRRNHITECMNLRALNVTFSTLPKIDEAEQMDEACQLKFYRQRWEGEPDGKYAVPKGMFRQLARVWLSKLEVTCHVASLLSGGTAAETRYLYVDANIGKEEFNYADALNAAKEERSADLLLRTQTYMDDAQIEMPWTQHLDGRQLLYNHTSCKPSMFGSTEGGRPRKLVLARLLGVTKASCSAAQQLWNAELSELIAEGAHKRGGCPCFDEEAILTRMLQHFPARVRAPLGGGDDTAGKGEREAEEREAEERKAEERKAEERQAEERQAEERKAEQKRKKVQEPEKAEASTARAKTKGPRKEEQRAIKQRAAMEEEAAKSERAKAKTERAMARSEKEMAEREKAEERAIQHDRDEANAKEVDRAFSNAESKAKAAGKAKAMKGSNEGTADEKARKAEEARERAEKRADEEYARAKASEATKREEEGDDIYIALASSSHRRD